MIKGLPPKKKEETPVETPKEEAPKSTGPKLKLRNTEEILKEEETDIEFSPEKDLEFPEEFYEIEDFNAQMFEENVMQLANELEKEHPKIRGYLKHILTNLHEYPKLSHLLNDKQIGLIVEGFKVQKKVEITAKKPAKSSATKELNKHSTEEILGMNW